jgi:hypothetical protein
LPAGLSYLYCSYCQITSLPSLPASLNTLRCDFNSLSSLPSLPPYLNELGCDYNQLVSLPVLPRNLTVLTCDSDLLSNLPELPDSLNFFNCQDNHNLTCLPEIKRIVTFVFNYTGITCLPDYGTVDNSTPYLISLPLCGIYNLNGCQPFWNISGKCFSSIDSSCVFDSVSKGSNYVKTQLFSGASLVQQTFTGGEGFYSFDSVPYGNYTVTIDTNNIPFTVNCPAVQYYADAI